MIPLYSFRERWGTWEPRLQSSWGTTNSLEFQQLIEPTPRKGETLFQDAGLGSPWPGLRGQKRKQLVNSSALLGSEAVSLLAGWLCNYFSFKVPRDRKVNNQQGVITPRTEENVVSTLLCPWWPFSSPRASLHMTMSGTWRLDLAWNASGWQLRTWTFHLSHWWSLPPIPATAVQI